MKLLLATSLVLWAYFALCPSSIAGRKAKCYKVYRKESRSCKRKMPGRYTDVDCCSKMRAAAYQIKKRGKRICVPCTTAENWSAWSPWKKCSSPCGSGISRRNRQCLDINEIGCPGRKSEKKACVNSIRPHCPVHGGWTDWSKWSACSVSCGPGLQLRSRTCTNPRPQHGGRNCLGAREQKQSCKNTPHCPINGGWGSWGSWTSCSVTCDIGWHLRVRACDNPKPKYGGKPCDPAKAIERRSCPTYTLCDGDASGSGDGSASGSGSGSGAGSGSSSKKGKDDDSDGSASGSGSGDGKPSVKPPTVRPSSDFDFVGGKVGKTTSKT